MKRFVLTVIFSCIILYAFSQEEIGSDTIPKFNLKVDLSQPITPERSFLGDDSFLLKLTLNQPLLPDYSKNLGFLGSLNSTKLSVQSYPISVFGYSPLLSSGKIFNQGSYQLNNRLSLGGNSFGARSVFDQPQLNPSIHDMSIRGTSMFLQYKVSKNFKVEGRVSISNHSNP